MAAGDTTALPLVAVAKEGAPPEEVTVPPLMAEEEEAVVPPPTAEEEGTRAVAGKGDEDARMPPTMAATAKVPRDPEVGPLNPNLLSILCMAILGVERG